MSMISAQIDELRKMAGKLESYDQGYGTICQALRDAADTIWQLRDDLQQAHERLADAEHDESRAWDRVRKAEAENAKLRELVQRMHGHIKESCDECDGWYCSNFDEDNECCVYDTLARELGIEVDG